MRTDAMTPGSKFRALTPIRSGAPGPRGAQCEMHPQERHLTKARFLSPQE
jgi:hypothetical protein